MQAVPINDDIGFLPLCSPPVYYAEMLIVAHRVAPFLAVRKYYSKGVLSLSHYFLLCCTRIVNSRRKKAPRLHALARGSSGKTRTYNPSVNSRMLCH